MKTFRNDQYYAKVGFFDRIFLQKSDTVERSIITRMRFGEDRELRGGIDSILTNLLQGTVNYLRCGSTTIAVLDLPSPIPSGGYTFVGMSTKLRSDVERPETGKACAFRDALTRLIRGMIKERTSDVDKQKWEARVQRKRARTEEFARLREEKERRRREDQAPAVA